MLALLLVVSTALAVVLAPHADILNILLSKGDVTSEAAVQASQATADITEEVESEAVILLKNKDAALPLGGNAKVNVFGSTAGNNFSYGGTGSGAGDESKNVTFYQGLENAGIQANPELKDFYDKNAKSAQKTSTGMVGTDWNLYELPQSDYDQSLIDNAKSYSDTAVVVLTRKDGEGYDLPIDMADSEGSEAGRSYLQLTPNEEALLDMAEKNFSRVVVVLNSPNPMELGRMNDDAVDAVLWVGTPGATGCDAIAKVLTGEVNPSGKTVDTFAYDLTSAPSYYNAGDFSYSNTESGNAAIFAGTGDAAVGNLPNYYVNYTEGIYVGYRYYETAAADGFIDYDSTVQYPFGYGLSYTTFDQKLDDVTDDGTTITATVTVTNTGSVAGKQVAEIYAAAPYTKGGIEKSSVALAGFGKTKLLEPGESQTLEISFDREDLASYDYTGVKAEGGAYVLEAGDYGIQLQTDSHNVVAKKTIHVDEDVIYDDAHDAKRSSDLVEAKNRSDAAGSDADLTYVSRADWAGTMPTERTPVSTEASDKILDDLNNKEPLDNSETEDVTFGAKNGLKLSDMKGLDCDDPQWDKLLDQVTLDEMKILVGNAGWMTTGVKSVDKPALVECDGPNGVNNIIGQVNSTQLVGQSNLGHTWNTELAARVGELFAQEAKALNIAGLYAPAANTHRTAFGGRNYEYVSEDGLLTGKIVAAEAKAIQGQGVYCYLKHFAANDQETHRADSGVLRGEWGFKGAVITDCTMAAGTSDVNRSVRAGNDINLNYLQDTAMTADTTDTAAGHQALRRATKNVLYMVVNSDALGSTHNLDMPSTIRTGCIVFGVVAIALFGMYLWRRHVKMVRWREAGKPAGRIATWIAGRKAKA